MARWGVGLIAMALGCGHAEAMPNGVPADEGWHGPELHARISGELDGEGVDVHLAALQLQESPYAFCERRYVVGDAADPRTWSEGRLTGIALSWPLGDPVDEEKDDVLVLERSDFTLDSGDAPLPVRAVLGKSLGRGLLRLGELSGQAGPDGLVVPPGEGRFGAGFEVAIPGRGRLRGSVTVPCVANELIAD